MGCILSSEEKARVIGLGTQGGSEEYMRRKYISLQRITRNIPGKHLACGHCTKVCFVPQNIPTPDQLEKAGLLVDR